ncbi:MAG: bifunctional nuclease family protein [Candidatus Omnitrophica bacterium]|nr:bifunctional nuclease family protein [Candidatus Omnitrophota bacterium]
MVELILSKIKIDERRNEQVIVLKEKNGHRMLPVVIGISEVQAIKLKLSGAELPRPLTHDLLLSAIRKLGAEVQKIVIDNLENNTFYAKLVLRDAQGAVVEIDARPSDSVAVALGAQAPIFIEEKVLEEAGLGEEESGQ